MKFKVTVMETCLYRCDCIVEADTPEAAEAKVEENGAAYYEERREIVDVEKASVVKVEAMADTANMGVT